LAEVVARCGGAGWQRPGDEGMGGMFVEMLMECIF
jgi:hypothetical protein